jgi:tetratricopeptide (TPR) repeat protein
MKNIFYLPAVLLIIFVSCSTAPKNSGDITQLRRLAEKEITDANNLVRRGHLLSAHALLAGCKQRAILIDNWSLIIRSSLALGNVMLSIENKKNDAIKEFEEAVALADMLNDKELIAVSNIYLIRSNIILGSAPANSMLTDIEKYAADIKSELYKAFSWQVKGLVQLRNKNYTDAEKSIETSLAIHIKANYLENAAYDWYTIASIRFLNDKGEEAIKALDEAIAIDRRIENSWGLAADWRAKGDVYSKMTGKGREARQAYERSMAIYTALNNKDDAGEIDRRITGLENIINQ